MTGDAPLRVRATASDDRAVRRVVELAPAHTLADLHAELAREFGLEEGHQWAFYLSGEWFDRASEYGGGGELPGERRGEEARVGDLGLELGDAIAYLNDFGDEQRLELEVVGFGEPGDAPVAPRVVAREGVPRPRAELAADPSAEAPLRPAPPLPPEALAELRAARDAWTLSAERPSERVALALDRVAALATALVNACASGEDLVALAEAEDWAIEKWLGEATRALAAEGDGEAALGVARRVAEIGRTRQPLVTVALAFAEVGRADLARRAIAAATSADAPLFPRSRLGLVQARLLLGDTEEAEADLRRLLAARWPSPKIRPLAARALGSLLEATGRTAEAEALRDSERARDAAAKGVVRREAPRVGRNDPCPCGSGKKFKKCHGAG